MAMLAVVIVVLGVLSLCYVAAFAAFKSAEVEQDRAKLALYQATIENELTRLEHLPGFLADDLAVKKVILGENSSDLNEKFEEITDASRAEAVYVMDRSGLTLAASNYDDDQTFLGQNYAFRPYFRDALAGKEGRFFAIGATTSRPGYFLSSPVRLAGEIIGVLVVKMDLTALNQILETTTDLIFVTNDDGIVVLSSQTDWQYRATRSIPSYRLTEIALDRQFAGEKIESVGWPLHDRDQVEIENTKYTITRKPLNHTLWQLSYLTDFAASKQRAASVVALVAVLIVILAMLFMFWRAQRVRRALTASQDDRRRLRREIEVRRKAEVHLENAQQELRRSNKMAALGQLAASVTHELGQPISAMKNYIAAEEISQTSPTPILVRLSGLVARMENITRQLRFFSTGNDDDLKSIMIGDVINNAIALVRHDMAREDIKLHTLGLDASITVKGNQPRLEQVIINLLGNAIKAMDDAPIRDLTIDLYLDDQNIQIKIQDTGRGLQGQSLEQIVEPFHTTGPSGEGMGLGLAISASIIHEHNGELAARDRSPCGAEFTITLPVNTMGTAT